MTLIDRVVAHLNETPLPAREGLPRPTWPNGAHGEHRYDGWCAVCRAGDTPDAFRTLVSAVLSFAEAEARREDRLLREHAAVSVGLTRERIAEAFDVPVELLGAPRLGAIPMAHALEPENEHTDPGTPQPVEPPAQIGDLVVFDVDRAAYLGEGTGRYRDVGAIEAFVHQDGAVVSVGVRTADGRLWTLAPGDVTPRTPAQPAPGVVHAYQWFIDPQFDGLTVACEEPITAAGLTATADRDVVTCPACLARIKVGDQ